MTSQQDAYEYAQEYCSYVELAIIAHRDGEQTEFLNNVTLAEESIQNFEDFADEVAEYDLDEAHACYQIHEEEVLKNRVKFIEQYGGGGV